MLVIDLFEGASRARFQFTGKSTEGGVTTVKHDSMREVTKITDANGNARKLSYVNRDWMKVAENPLGMRTTNVQNGNLLSATVTDDGRTTLIYDGGRTGTQQ